MTTSAASVGVDQAISMRTSLSPRITVLIRTFNEQKHLGRLLDMLDRQTERDFEIVLVDSGSADRTLHIAEGRVQRIIRIDSRNFTFGYSLNVGCRASRGTVVVIVSAHAIPANEQWLAALTRPFEDSRVAMVYGRHIGAEQTKLPERRDFARFFPKQPGPRRYGNNANSAIRRSVWEQQPFDERLTGLEDIAWAKNATKQGLTVVYEPQAAVLHIHEETPTKVYNRYRREALAARRMGLTQPPHAGVGLLSFFRNVAEDTLAIARRRSFGLLVQAWQFRVQQWRGSRHGWLRDIDAVKERGDLYYSGENRGVIISRAGQAEFGDLPMPELAPGEVLIRVAYVGICATDLEVASGTLGYYHQGLAKYPIVPGHEFSGEVVSVGANASSRWNVGDRVVGECILSCGVCVFCQRGTPVACRERREVGVMNYHGAYAKYISLPAHALHRVLDGLDLTTACLAEPLAVSLRAIRRAKPFLRGNERWAVIGAGPIGNLCGQALKAYGHSVTVLNRSSSRLDHLRDVLETRIGLQDFDTFDIIVEATGSVDALKAILAGCRPGAVILLLGFPYGKMDFNFESVVGREHTMLGSVGGSAEDFEEALRLLPTFHTAPLTETIVPLPQFQQAWELHRSSSKLKILLKVRE